MALTKGDQFLGAAHTGLGFERAGPVVDAGVDHAAVVAGLVAGQPVFFLHNGECDSGQAVAEFQSGGQTDNTAANNTDIELPCHPPCSRHVSLTQPRLGVKPGRPPVLPFQR